MRIADFAYHLPEELIAQEPARPRDSSRLLVLHRDRNETEHRRFRDLPEYLSSDDLVVFNDTRVMRARLRGRRCPGGGRAEVLLLEERGGGVWEAVVSPGRRLPPGREIVFGEGKLRAEVMERTANGGRLLRFSGAADPWGCARASLADEIARLAELPLPPYVHRALDDEADYQTVYARAPGASAAPTAGLHFSEELLREVQVRVSGIAHLTLHIGLSTFRPIHTENVEDHQMHGERFHIPEQTATLASQAVEQGRRVVAVGTSTARALEAAADERGRVAPGPGETDLFIRPGYQFRVVGALVTNFHMPRSTLLVMVCTFAGREKILRAYEEAVGLRYRFLSFGDAMLIV
jgi:S-adenosylmethionine:tRNA ribosyltransferase-isomerase